jgi:ribonucleoside-diphosphate reductase beta chain
MVQMEPMTLNPEDRLCLMPIQHADIDENYETQLSKFWTHHEIDHSQDAKSWATMNFEEQQFISKALAFFANSDNAVLSNIATRFRAEITWPEVQLALGQQASMEGIHVKSYNNMIDSVIPDPVEKIKLFHAVKNDPIIAKKLEWTMKWAGDPKTPLHVCFVAQCLVEGVFFSPNFASMKWMRKNQICPGICFGNEKIIEDEALHVKLFALLYKNCVNKMSREDLEVMCREVVALEHEFVDASLPYRIKGMNKEMMKQYVCKVCDTVLEQLGEAKLYNVANPFPFMEGVGLLARTNFFEKRVAEYQLPQKETEIKTTQFTELGVSLDF